MGRATVLTLDGIIHLALGALLIIFPNPVIELLGLPLATLAFYPSMLGSVFLGLALALFLGAGGGRSGLGLAGAAAINLISGLVLAGWLLVGNLILPRQGVLAMWLLVFLSIAFSVAELLTSDEPSVR